MTSEILIQNSVAAQHAVSASQTGTNSATTTNSEAPVVLQNPGVSAGSNLNEQTIEAKKQAEDKNQPVSKAEVDDAVKEIKAQLESVGRDINFSVDDELDIVIITVSDKDSEEVVRQIPSKEIVELARHNEDNKGLLFREEV